MGKRTENSSFYREVSSNQSLHNNRTHPFHISYKNSRYRVNLSVSLLFYLFVKIEAENLLTFSDREQISNQF